MGEWCTKQHGESGLTQKVKESETNLTQCEEKVLTFVQNWTPPGKCPLAGNSVGQDGKFLVKYMPKFMEHLHYRIVDVSSVKELCKRWFPKEFSQIPSKKLTHRALDDIKESIEELKYYRENIFKSPK
jgi:oligoribonuclease